MAKASATILQIRRLLKQNGFKRGTFRIERERRKTASGWEYSNYFIHMRKAVSPEALNNLTHDGLILYLKSSLPIFKF